MPTSNLQVAPFVVNMVEEVRHDRVLDVGPGWGKYAVLLREYLNVKPVTIDAVEAWAPYIERHHLRRLYDTVYLGDAAADEWGVDPHLQARYAADLQLRTYDVILMVDVIEHMTKPAAWRLIDRAPQARIVVCTPLEFFHNGDGLPPTEEHVSHWTPSDFADGRRNIEQSRTDKYGALLVRLGPMRGHARSEGAHRAVT